METLHLKSSVDKIIQNCLLRIDIEVSEPLKNSLIKMCYELIEQITISSGFLCEKDSKNLLSENHLIPIFIDLGLGRYISEIKEEQNRIKEEEMKLDKINI